MAIELAGNAVEFDAFGEHWRCRLDSYACELAEFTPPGNPLEVPSPDKTVAVSQRGHDLWARSLSDGREWALTTDGEPDDQYGSGPDCTSNGTLLRKFGLPHLPPAVAWSPDSTKVLAHRTDERGVRQTHLVEARPADGGAPVLRTQRYAYPGDENMPQAELVVLDVSEGTVVSAQAEPLLMPQSSPITTKWAWWAPDGSAVYYLGQPRATCARSPCTGWTRPPARSPLCSARPGPPALSPTSGATSRRSCGCWPTRCCGTRSGTAGATCTGTTYAPASCSGRSPPGSGRCGRACTSTRPGGWCTSPSPGWSTRIRTVERCAGSVVTAPASQRSPTTSWTTSSPCRTPWSTSSTPRPLWTPAGDDGSRLVRAGAGRAGARRHQQAHRHRLDAAGTVLRQGGRRGDGHLRGAVPAAGVRPRPALPGGGQRLPRPAGRPGRPVLRPRRDGPRHGTHRGAGFRGGGGGWARHPRAEQVLPRRLLRPLGRRGLPGRPCRGAAAAGPDPAVDGPGPDGRVRPLRWRVRHSAGDAGLPRGVQGRSRPLRPARRPLLQPGLRGDLRRRGQSRGLGPYLQRGPRGPVGGQAAAHPRRNGRPSPSGPHAAAGRPGHCRRQGLRAAHRARGRAHVHRLPGLRPQALLGLPGARADRHAATRLPPRPHRHRPRVARRDVRLSATPQTRNQGTQRRQGGWPAGRLPTGEPSGVPGARAP